MLNSSNDKLEMIQRSLTRFINCTSLMIKMSRDFSFVIIIADQIERAKDFEICWKSFKALKFETERREAKMGKR